MLQNNTTPSKDDGERANAQPIAPKTPCDITGGLCITTCKTKKAKKLGACALVNLRHDDRYLGVGKVGIRDIEVALGPRQGLVRTAKRRG